MIEYEHLEDLQRISKIPISYYDGDELVLRKPDLPYMDKLIGGALPTLRKSNRSVVLSVTDELLFCGMLCIAGTQERIIFGPVLAISCDHKKALRILQHYDFPLSDANAIMSYFQSLQICSLFRFASFLRFTAHVYNHEEIDIISLLPNDYQFEEETHQSTPMDKILSHDAQEHEQYMYALIRHGRVNEMSSFISREPFSGNIGMLADTVSRHHKNLVIASITLAARSANSGGVNYDTAMKAADTYIQKVELSTNTKTLFNLHRNMLRQYTQLVHEAQQNKTESAFVARVHSYIDMNIDNEISVTHIASALNFSRTYLSAQFKKETGINLNQFVNQLKIEEACRLLNTSDLLVVDIAAKLSFSSQSQFQAVFKRITGMTPLAYKKKQILYLPN